MWENGGGGGVQYPKQVQGYLLYYEACECIACVPEQLEWGFGGYSSVIV